MPMRKGTVGVVCRVSVSCSLTESGACAIDHFPSCWKPPRESLGSSHFPPPPPADVLPPGCGESSIDGASSVCRPAATDAIPVTSEALAVIRLPAPRAAAEMTTADDFNCFGPGVNNPRKLSSPVQESGWRGWETRSHRVKPIL